MKGLIIYKSKYGASRQYAHWIGNDLNFPVINVKDVTRRQLQEAGIIIVGSSIYAGRALIRRWLQIHRKELAGKMMFLFFVSGTPAGKALQLEKYRLASVPPELCDNSHVFFFPGKLIYSKLSWFDRIILRVGSILMKKSGQKNIFRDYNEVKREHINEMVASITNEIAIHDAPLQEPEGSYPVKIGNNNGN